jgi:hypothetical protein
VPQVITGSSAISPEIDGSLGVGIAHLPREAHELLSLMLSYEAAAQRKRGKAEQSSRKIDRVGLISSFLAVCAHDVAGPLRNERAMSELCDSVLRTDHPSHELMGTFLAALELSPKDVPGVRPRIRRAMIAVLQTCVEMLSHDIDPPQRI